jgi:hypothetical protein
MAAEGGIGRSVVTLSANSADFLRVLSGKDFLTAEFASERDALKTVAYPLAADVPRVEAARDCSVCSSLDDGPAVRE